ATTSACRGNRDASDSRSACRKAPDCGLRYPCVSAQGMGMKRFETAMESVLFRSRWLLAPFFFGLIVAIIALLVKFGKELLSLVTGLLGMNGSELIVSILTLVDSALIASLLLIIAFSGYENFV